MGILHDTMRGRAGLRPRTSADPPIPPADRKLKRKPGYDPHINAPVIEAEDITEVVSKPPEVVSKPALPTPPALNMAGQIEAAVKQLGSASALAEKAGMSRAYLSQIRTGKRPASERLRETVKKVLGENVRK